LLCHRGFCFCDDPVPSSNARVMTGDEARRMALNFAALTAAREGRQQLNLDRQGGLRGRHSAGDGKGRQVEQLLPPPDWYERQRDWIAKHEPERSQEPFRVRSLHDVDEFHAANDP
jgi:hypothetical protein